MRMWNCAVCVMAIAGTSVAADPAGDYLVVSASQIASDVGADVMADGGNAIDAAVATAFALAVTVPRAGNIGGGGFLLYQPAEGDPIAYDFREVAPASASEDMWLVDGEYDAEKHHWSHASVGVPGTVAGLYLAWQDHGTLAWDRLLTPAVELARDGFIVGPGLAASIEAALPRLSDHAASVDQFTNNGALFDVGDTLVQADLAATLGRIAEHGPEGFYSGITADLIVAEMESHDGLITHEDLAAYKAVRRKPIRGTYRGNEIIGFPPPSSGGVVTVQALNILEGYDVSSLGAGSSQLIHLYAESFRRAYSDRALYLGDPDFNPGMPLEHITSKYYAAELRATIDSERASTSSRESFSWPKESDETTHLSVVDSHRNAVALTYTLEQSYGSGIVVPGAGFLLNNEMGDFNPAPGMTTERGHIGTAPNLTAPGKRMLSSMSPTIVRYNGDVRIVTGSPGGRTIITTVIQTIINIIDFGMTAQESTAAARVHHQWLPDEIRLESYGFDAAVLNELRELGHELKELSPWGAAQIITVNPKTDTLDAGVDPRRPDAGASGR